MKIGLIVIGLLTAFLGFAMFMVAGSRDHNRGGVTYGGIGLMMLGLGCVLFPFA